MSNSESDDKEQEYDYDGYTKSLEKILDGVTKDYWASYIDVGRHQLNVGKTYLWVSAAQLGIYSAAYKEFNNELISNSCALVIGITSFIICCIAFGICLYAIPARKGYKTIPEKGWGEFSNQAFNDLKSGSRKVYATFLANLISKVDESFAHNFSTNLDRARLLRHTSWLLIVSFVLAIFVAAALSNDT